MSRYCFDCNADISRRHLNARRCHDCADLVNERGPLNISTQAAAQAIARWAQRGGILPQIDGSIDCVDCGFPAQVYDHRDYLKPLDVDPVCFSCNTKRGQGKNAIINKLKRKEMENAKSRPN